MTKVQTDQIIRDKRNVDYRIIYTDTIHSAILFLDTKTMSGKTMSFRQLPRPVYVNF